MNSRLSVGSSMPAAWARWVVSTHPCLRSGGMRLEGPRRNEWHCKGLQMSLERGDEGVAPRVVKLAHTADVRRKMPLGLNRVSTTWLINDDWPSMSVPAPTKAAPVARAVPNRPSRRLEKSTLLKVPM